MTHRQVNILLVAGLVLVVAFAAAVLWLLPHISIITNISSG